MTGKRICSLFIAILFISSGLLVFTGCKNDVITEVNYGSIIGKVLYSNSDDHSDIVVTLDKTDGLRAITSNDGSRSIVAMSNSKKDGSFAFYNLEPGVYTVYASSNNSIEKAVSANVVVEGSKTVTTEDLQLTATGNICGYVLVDANTTGNMGFLVFLAGTSYVSVTDDSGYYCITGVPAGKDYQLVVSRGNYISSKVSNCTVVARVTSNAGVKNLSSDEVASGTGALIWKGSFANAPVNPTTNWAYYNTTDGCSYIYDGLEWTLLASKGDKGDQGEPGTSGTDGSDGVSITWKGSLSEAPANSELYWAYFNTEDGCSYIDDGTQWSLLAARGAQGIQGETGAPGPQGEQGIQGETGATGPDGVSIIWLGSFECDPENPTRLNAYFNTETGCSYIFNGTTWDLLASKGTHGEQGQSGAAGTSITWKGSLVEAPAEPELYWAYFNTETGCSYIFDGTKWTILASSGKDGNDGDSIVWKGSFNSYKEISNPEKLWAFYCNLDGCSYVYDGEEWNLLASRGGDGSLFRSGSGRYGYEFFAETANGREKQLLYSELFNACEAFYDYEGDVPKLSDDVDFYYFHKVRLSDYPSLNIDDYASVWRIFTFENPIYYWISNSVRYDDSYFYFAVGDEYISGQERDSTKAAIASMVEECRTFISDAKNNLEKAYLIQKYISEEIEYAYVSGTTNSESALWAHNLDGVARKGKGVCETYAKTYFYLCTLNGIECLVVSGDTGEEHAWNLININGNWYGVDVTWDDENSSQYFFGSSKNLLTDTNHNENNPNNTAEFFLYDLPDISEQSIELILLYENEKKVGYFESIDDALTKMNSSSSRYEIQLVNYPFLSSDIVYIPQYSVSSNALPSVASIKFSGNTVVLSLNGKDSFFSSLITMENNCALNSDLELSDISLVMRVLTIGEKQMILSGVSCQLGDSESSDTSIIGGKNASILIDTEKNAEFFCSVEVNTVSVKKECWVRFYNDVHLDRYTGRAGVDSVLVNIQLDSCFSTDENVFIIRYLDSTYSQVVKYSNNKVLFTFGEINGDIQIFSELSESELHLSGGCNGTVKINPLGEAFGLSFNSNVFISDEIDYSKVTIILGTSDGSKFWTSVGKGMFLVDNTGKIYVNPDYRIENDFVIYGDVVYRYLGNQDKVSVPDSVTAIGSTAFSGMSIKGAVIPEGVTEIGENAFAECESLVCISLPSTLKTIGRGAFANTGLENVEIPSGTTEIGEYAFLRCGNLKKITIPGSVNTIGFEAFAFCRNLTEVIIENGVQRIASQSFAYCTSLTDFVFPESVVSIDFTAPYFGAVLAGCSGLISVTVPVGLTLEEGNENYLATNCNSLQEVHFNGTMEQWNNGAFKGNRFAHVDHEVDIYCIDGVLHRYVYWQQSYD